MPTVPVTVLMTVRNGEMYVAEAVRSILSQTCGDFKFLILDNASTDQTREIVLGFQDPRIELIELEHDLGQSGALNRGLALADTPYIARIDADDISHPLRLERQVEFLRENPRVALLGTWCDIIDPNGQVFKRYSPFFEYTTILKSMLFENQFAHSSVIYKREIAMACGSYDVDLKCSQDYTLWWRIISAHAAANVPEYLVQVRWHPGQVSLAFDSPLVVEALRMVDYALNNISLPEKIRHFAPVARRYTEIKYAARVSNNGLTLKPLFQLMGGLFETPSLIIERIALRYIASAFLKGMGLQRNSG